MILDLLNIVRGILKYDEVTIDNNIFRLHYKVTMIMLILFSLAVTSKQFIGDPIECYTKDESRNIDTYCWIFSTFTVRKHLQGIPGKKFAQSGVGTFTENDIVIHHKYYQWVFIVLAFQAAMFYIPRYLWKTWESGLLKMLVGDLGLPLVSSEWTEDKKEKLLKYIGVHSLHTHTIYAARFSLCEILNAVNVIFQFVIINFYLGNDFTSYGPAVYMFMLEEKPLERVDPMALLFPKASKCTYREYGPSGNIQTVDALCILPLNIINEKIFLIIWYWFVLLAVISILGIFTRTVIILSSAVKAYLLMAKARHIKRETVNVIIREFYYSDWFLLYMIGLNVNPIIFRELILDLSALLSERGKSKTYRRSSISKIL